MKKQFLQIAFITMGASFLLFNCTKKKEDSPEPTTNTTPTPTSPTTPTTTTPTSNGLTANQFKIGSTVFSTSETPGWQANGYSGYSGLSNQFKAIFSKKGPVTGTYKVVSVVSALTTVSDGEIGIYVTQNYFSKSITSNTGTATVTHENGEVKILVTDVTMGADKFSAHYVIGNANKHIYIDNNSLDPQYDKSHANGPTVIKTYGSQTSDYDSWGVNFYFKDGILTDGTFTTIPMPSSGLSFVPAGNVYIIAEKGNISSFTSDLSSGSITVSGKKMTFNGLVLKKGTETITLKGVYQF